MNMFFLTFWYAGIVFAVVPYDFENFSTCLAVAGNMTQDADKAIEFPFDEASPYSVFVEPNMLRVTCEENRREVGNNILDQPEYTDCPEVYCGD